jgi:hypothetical protein
MKFDEIESFTLTGEPEHGVRTRGLSSGSGVDDYDRFQPSKKCVRPRKLESIDGVSSKTSLRTTCGVFERANWQPLDKGSCGTQ